MLDDAGEACLHLFLDRLVELFIDAGANVGELACAGFGQFAQLAFEQDARLGVVMGLAGAEIADAVFYAVVDLGNARSQCAFHVRELGAAAGEFVRDCGYAEQDCDSQQSHAGGEEDQHDSC